MQSTLFLKNGRYNLFIYWKSINNFLQGWTTLLEGSGIQSLIFKNTTQQDFRDMFWVLAAKARFSRKLMLYLGTQSAGIFSKTHWCISTSVTCHIYKILSQNILYTLMVCVAISCDELIWLLILLSSSQQSSLADSVELCIVRSSACLLCWWGPLGHSCMFVFSIQWVIWFLIMFLTPFADCVP